jgi:hypothetical protein
MTGGRKLNKVTGHTVVAVRQERVYDTRTGRWVTLVGSLVLDNGVELYLEPVVLEDECGVRVVLRFPRGSE